MNNYVAFFARILLAQIFLVAILLQLMIILKSPSGYQDYQLYLGQHGLPGIFAPLMILIQLVAGAALLIGYKTRAAAFVLAAYAIFIAFAIKLRIPIEFMQYLAVAGGMLAVAAHPSSAFSVDGIKQK